MKLSQVFYCIRHQDRLAEYMFNGNTYCKECVSNKTIHGILKVNN